MNGFCTLTVTEAGGETHPLSRQQSAVKRLARRLASRLAVSLLLLACLQARAEISPTAFDAANKLYEQGKFTDAISAYGKLLESNQASAALYFNLGNAFFKAGELGRAIAAYHQAEEITPRDPDLRANLQFTRNQIQGPTLAPSVSQRWLRKLSLNEWTCLAAAAVWLWFLLLTRLQWRPALKPILRNYVIIAGVATGLLCVCLGLAWENRLMRTAIVITHDAVVRQAPLEESQSAFSVYDGAELRVLDQKDNWLQVSPDPRRIGWVRRDQVLVSTKRFGLT